MWLKKQKSKITIIVELCFIIEYIYTYEYVHLYIIVMLIELNAFHIFIYFHKYFRRSYDSVESNDVFHCTYIRTYIHVYIWTYIHTIRKVTPVCLSMIHFYNVHIYSSILLWTKIVISKLLCAFNVSCCVQLFGCCKSYIFII